MDGFSTSAARTLFEGLSVRDTAVLGPDHAIGEALRGELSASEVEPAFDQ